MSFLGTPHPLHNKAAVVAGLGTLAVLTVLPELAFAQPAALPLPTGVAAGAANAVPVTAVEGSRFVLKLLLTIVAVIAVIVAAKTIISSLRNAQRSEDGYGESIPAITFSVLVVLVSGVLVTVGWAAINTMAITF